QFLRVFQSAFRRIAPRVRSSIVAVKVERRLFARKSCPGNRKLGVKLHRSLIRVDGFPCDFGIHRIASAAVEGAHIKSQAAQVSIVSLWIVRWFNGQRLLLAPGYLRL